MTEVEWLQGIDLKPMLEEIWGKASERKLRLAGYECSRRILPLLSDSSLSTLLSTVERVIDSPEEQSAIVPLLADLQRRMDATQPAAAEFNGIAGVAFAAAHPPANRRVFENSFLWLADAKAWAIVPSATIDPDDWESPRDPMWKAAWEEERRQQASVFREVLGNPLRPVDVDRSWLSSTVVTLAAGIYQDREFDWLPILADALMDAGCNNEDILNHLRGEGPHLRGCWALDLVLEKS
jgi:hypothetical protein